MKYSFIIPTRNEEKYIKDCIVSIKEQHATNAEIIVVDSNSTDKTVSIAKKLGAKIVSEPRRGPSIARNTGAKYARGTILIFADADVRFAPDFLDALDQSFGTLGGAIFHLDPYDAPSVPIKLSYSCANILVLLVNKLGFTMTIGSCFVFEKRAFFSVDGFDPELLTNEDHDIARRISKTRRIEYFPNIRVKTSSRRVSQNGLFRMILQYTQSTFLYFVHHKSLPGYWLRNGTRSKDSA